MQQNLKKILIAVLAVIVFGLPTIQAEETETLLRWKNSDILPGQLLESKDGKIRWASPYFLDDLVLDVNVLEAVVFPKTPNPATETFRVSTVSGDVWIADLIGSDNNTFLFSSKRHSQFRVERSAVSSLEHRKDLTPLFDGSELTNWKSSKTQKDIDDLILIPLAFDEPTFNWRQNNEGHLHTSQNKAELFHAFKWHKHFEIDLALAFTEHPPSFVFALGKDLYQALRLEVWSDKLVAVQGTLFQPVLTIQPEQRNFRLRLTYNESTSVLRVFDAIGNLLLTLEGIKPTVKESGPYIQNQGKSLTVQALKVYRRPVSEPTGQQVDFTKPHVYMMNGQIVQGKLFVQKDSTYVLDADGTQQNIDLQQVSRVVQPGIPPTALDPPVTLEYPDEVVLHGKITHVNLESVMLQTAFAEAPVTCALAGASKLRFNTNANTNRKVQKGDRLFHATGTLGGDVLFDENRGTSFIQWESRGALKPVRLANNQTIHIRQFLQPTSKVSQHFDTKQFPHALHLQTGETFPCHITTYDGKSINFQSPFISVQHLDSATLKALEFSDRTSVPSSDRVATTNRMHSIKLTLAGGGNVPQNHEIQIIEISKDGKQKVIKGDFKIVLENGMLEENGRILLLRNNKAPEKAPNPGWMELATALHEPKTNKLDAELERALTVPRLNRDNPPNHILVANTKDMMRGKFLGFNGQMLQFDSKLRKFSVPIDRVARVVDVSGDSRQPSAISNQKRQNPLSPTAIQSEVRVTLIDGSMLIFEPLEVKDGQLIGRSSVYGEVSVPVGSIEYLYFGEKAKSFKKPFEKWNIRPAKEPARSPGR